jgi:lipopolysaccharide transport system permease protein
MGNMIESLYYAWKSRRAWWFTATARTKARFARTIFGGFWLGLSNLLSIMALATVYGTVFKVNHFPTYIVYVGLGLVTWNSLSGAISSAPTLFEHNASQLRNTNLDPIFYTLEEWAFQVQTFLQSFALVLIGLTFFDRSLPLHMITSGWLPLANFIVFIYWVPLLICLLGARYRDTYQLVPIALQLVFLLSPILYEKKNLGALGWTADFNPIYRVISPLRASLLHGSIDLPQVLAVSIMNIVGLAISLWMLNKERRFLPFIV